MSTLKVAAINNAAASSGGIAISSAGNVTGTGMDLITPTSIAYSGGSASVSGGAVTFSGVSSVSLNGCFSATYARYMIMWDGGGSVNPGSGSNFRLRSSGTDATGSNYYSQRLYGAGATVAASRTGALTYASAGSWDYLNNSATQLTMYNPFVAANTMWHEIGISNADTSNNSVLEINGGTHSLSTSYDGFTILASSGTCSGTVRVYGYKN